MSKLKKFPMKVRCGSSSVTIYRQQAKRGYYSYVVRFYRGTEEVRITRSNFEDAHREAQAAARSLAHGELDVLTLRSDDRLSYVRAVQAVESTGVSLEKAAADYAEALHSTFLKTVFGASRTLTSQPSPAAELTSVAC